MWPSRTICSCMPAASSSYPSHHTTFSGRVRRAAESTHCSRGVDTKPPQVTSCNAGGDSGNGQPCETRLAANDTLPLNSWIGASQTQDSVLSIYHRRDVLCDLGHMNRKCCSNHWNIAIKGIMGRGVIIAVSRLLWFNVENGGIMTRSVPGTGGKGFFRRRTSISGNHASSS